MGVGVIFLTFCLISAWLIYYHEKNLLEEAAYEKAEIVLAAAEASRHYIQEVLRPKMYESASAPAIYQRPGRFR